MAKLGAEYKLPELRLGKGVKFEDTEHYKELKRLQDISEKLPDGEVVGGVISFQVCDGYAMYLVTKDKPLTLRHIDWLDGYCIPDAHVRGLRIQDVRDRLMCEKRLRDIFSKR